jgi:hypothetical protein
VKNVERAVVLAMDRTTLDGLVLQQRENGLVEGLDIKVLCGRSVESTMALTLSLAIPVSKLNDSGFLWIT